MPEISQRPSKNKGPPKAPKNLFFWSSLFQSAQRRDISIEDPMNEASRFENMTEDQFNDELERRYPEIWEKTHPVFLIGRGWWTLIEEFYEEMNRQYSESENKEAWLNAFRVIKIQNKLGYLQIYYAVENAQKSATGSDLDLIKRSQKICEECGKEGELRPNLDYIQTLCDEHYEHYKKIRGIKNDF